MKAKNIIIVLIVSFFWLYSCKTTQETNHPILSFSLGGTSQIPALKISFHKGESYNRPTFALWMENLNGEYIRTLFVTKSYASGIFGHELVGDSIWGKTSGPSLQPAALPYWTYKKGLIEGKYLLPIPEHPFLDAYTGATPDQNFELKALSNINSRYRMMLEVNQSWDLNEYWTNNKYPDSKAYSHSAQPSIIYSVEINDDHKIFYMNPIGYGNPKGEDGKLNTNLNTLSTAMKIFKMIKIEILKN